ncbi:MAG: ATP-binding protein [Clostridia bacterium]|nr:ATP-binding protein [Clostridia bacterium]
MLSKVKSFALRGLEGYPVDIEADINAGIPSMDTVGLPDTAIKEAKDRVRSAIKNSGLAFPIKRITINLAPADTKKEGAGFDLPIAIAILIASEQITPDNAKEYVFVGELSLDGSLREVNGIMPILISGMQSGYTKFIIPCGNGNEASYIEGIEVYAANSLSEVCAHLDGIKVIEKIEHRIYNSAVINNKYGYDFSEVNGQANAKRALEIAVSGGHNVLMIGPPGTGKTMLAKCVLTIMPDLTFDEAVEITKIHSIAGLLDASKGIINVRPFRTPHHSATIPALVGGDRKAKPGEVSLAHYGVLFLDEVPEYNRRALEALRQPMEDGVITVSRILQTVEYPANFMLIGSMNPCPCGNFGSKNNECTCSSQQINNYINKISGPLLDRIDIQIEVDNISFGDFSKGTAAECSADIKKRVMQVRAAQHTRYAGESIYTNSEMNNRQIKKYCAIDKDGEGLLEIAFNKLGLSARGSYRILRVARTIADMENSEKVLSRHLAEAIQYRSLDRKYWSR